MCHQASFDRPGVSGDHGHSQLDPLEIIAHEMRAPLAYVAAVGELLQGDQLDPKTLANIGATLRQRSQRLTELLEELVSSVIQKTPTVSLVPFNVTKLTDECVNNARQDYPSCKFSLNLPAHAFWCSGSPALVAAILRNLLDNAARASKQGNVWIAFDPENEYIRIAISDSGPGLSAQALAIICGESQLTEPRQYNHHGLGLYICQYLSRLTGGSLSASQHSGHDQVVLRLPLFRGETQ